MIVRFALAGALVALALSPAPLAAQQNAAPLTPDAVAARLTTMKGALRALVVAQEKHYADHGTYTTDPTALGLLPRAADKKGEPLPQVIFAGGRGWSGIVVDFASRKSYVIYVGYADELPAIPMTRVDRTAAKNEGEPICDKP